MEIEDDFTQPLSESPDDMKRFARPGGTSHKTRRRKPEEVKPRGPGRTLAERRAATRERRLPKDRICPSCGQLVLDSKRWVVKVWTLFKRVVICRKCSYKAEYRPSDSEDMAARYAWRKRRAELRALRLKLLVPLLPADRACPLCGRVVMRIDAWRTKRVDGQRIVTCDTCD